MDWLCIHMHNVYDVQSAAPPLVDISINRVHIALVPAQLVVPEHWSFSRAGLVFRNKVKFYCRHSAFTYTADPTYRYCSGTTMAMWTRPKRPCFNYSLIKRRVKIVEDNFWELLYSISFKVPCQHREVDPFGIMLLTPVYFWVVIQERVCDWFGGCKHYLAVCLKLIFH